MPHDPARGSRPGAGRPAGRGRADTPATRTSSRPAHRTAHPRTTKEPVAEQAGASGTGGSTLAPRLRSRMRFTQRALVLAVVIVVLLVSYGTTLRVYFNQQHAIAETRAQIAEHEQAISTLEDEISRWQDPEYVKIQARERLGWVLPGEVGFRVVGPDGEPYAGGQQIGVGRLPDGEHSKTWWDRMWGSVQTADDPTPEEEASPGEPIRPTPEPTEGP